MARAGSLNSAAQQIGVSQQAVSARVRAMEAQTGVPLVRRSPRGSGLTPQGAVIAEWASRLLDVAAWPPYPISQHLTGTRLCGTPDTAPASAAAGPGRHTGPGGTAATTFRPNGPSGVSLIE